MKLMALPLEDPTIRRRLKFYLRLRKVVKHLENHPGENITLTDAASVACMERTSFSKFFHRAVGLKFHEFVTAWRIQSVIQMMTASDRSISEIAYEAGFQNLASFERAFRKLCGCTPSTYRNKLLRKSRIIAPKRRTQTSAYQPSRLQP